MSETPKESKDKTPPVTLLEDPYGLNHFEISDAQDSSEELALDADLLGEGSEEKESAGTEAVEDLSASSEMLDRMAEAIETESKKQEKEAEELTQLSDAATTEEAGETEEERQARELAAQIAEDQALEQEMAKEAADEAKEEDAELLAALPKHPVAAETNAELDLAEVESCIEALLFMSEKPLSTQKLREWLGPDFEKEIFEQALASLTTRFQTNHHGIELVEVAGGYQFRTKPARAALARRLSKVQTQRLSSGAMESLAIIAYKQPVLKEEIDKIRGVDSSYFIRGLLDKKLITISGRSDLPGRPMVYSTTNEFLEVFGLKDLSALPSMQEIEKMIPASQTKNPDEEDPRVKQMRQLVSQMTHDTSTTLNYDPREDEKILKDIREKVNAIPVSTPYLEQQKALEKEAKIAAASPQAQPEQPELSAEISPSPEAEVLTETEAPSIEAASPEESLDDSAPPSA